MFDRLHTARHDPVVGAIYLGALVLGLGTIVAQMLMAGHGDADGDIDAHGEVDLDGHGDPGGDSHAIQPHHPAADFVALFLSIRFWTFALMAFGIAGTIQHYLFDSDTLTTLVSSVVLGFGSGALAAWVFRAVAASSTTSGTLSDDLVGQVGRVMLPCSPGQQGKVRLEVKGQLIEYLATADDALAVGNAVMVEEVRGNVVHVSGAPDTLAGVS